MSARTIRTSLRIYHLSAPLGSMATSRLDSKPGTLAVPTLDNVERIVLMAVINRGLSILKPKVTPWGLGSGEFSAVAVGTLGANLVTLLSFLSFKRLGRVPSRGHGSFCRHSQGLAPV